MLNEDYKRTAIADLEKAYNVYVRAFDSAVRLMTSLHQMRERAVITIKKAEVYVQGLANKPRDFDTTIEKIKINYLDFSAKIEQIKHLDQSQKYASSSRGWGGSVLTGAGTAVFASNAPMAVAMAFGNASTATAISSLSGATATNSALAWLRGGSLSSNCAGIAGGQSLSAAIGPIGWIIGSGVPMGSILRTAIKNHELAQKAERATIALMRETERIREISVTVTSLRKKVIDNSNKILAKLSEIRRKKDYSQLSRDDQYELTMFMNMVEVLSKQLGETVS